MSKLIYIIVAFILLIFPTTTKIEKPNYKLSDLVIEYNRSSVMEYNAPFYEVKLYADKYITYGYSNEDDLIRRDLTDEEYKEIIDYAFSNVFMSLDTNLTNPNILDGEHSGIYLYADGEIIFHTGGDNVTNSRYNKLVHLLMDKKKEEEK